jgi:hypothetical protein
VADEPEIIASNRFRIGKGHKPRGPLIVVGNFYQQRISWEVIKGFCRFKALNLEYLELD